MTGLIKAPGPGWVDTRFIGGRPEPRLPPGQPSSCGPPKPGRQGRSEESDALLELRESKATAGRGVLLGLDSDDKSVRDYTRKLARTEDETNELNSKAEPSWDVREEGRLTDRCPTSGIEAAITIAMNGKGEGKD
ncbi:hypothetical protein MHU86_21872 [Fragilaria crotonensis]|nr:hypothetical protein MHU86_21872 [Fragilaria crotonensis]